MDPLPIFIGSYLVYILFNRKVNNRARPSSPVARVDSGIRRSRIRRAPK